MKKGIIIAVIAILLAGGGYWLYSQNAKPKPIYEDPNPGEKKGLTVLENTTLEGWLKKGKAVECELTTEQGTVKVMTKDGKVRIEGIPYMFGENMAEPKNDGISLTDGDWMYMWSGTKGTKMNIKAMQETMTEEQKVKESYSWEDNVKNWENLGTKYDCAEKKLSDDLFQAPAEVAFNDMTKMMQDLQQIGQQMQQKTDSGAPMNMEDIEAQLEQIQAGQGAIPNTNQ